MVPGFHGADQAGAAPSQVRVRASSCGARGKRGVHRGVTSWGPGKSCWGLLRLDMSPGYNHPHTEDSSPDERTELRKTWISINPHGLVYILTLPVVVNIGQSEHVHGWTIISVFMVEWSSECVHGWTIFRVCSRVVDALYNKDSILSDGRFLRNQNVKVSVTLSRTSL